MSLHAIHADRRSLLRWLAASAASLPALQAGAQSRAKTVRELTWPELIPAGWDPARSLGVPDLSTIDPDTPAVRKIWDNAPLNTALNGRTVRMLGYLVPLDESAQRLSEFLLVAQWGACIHTPAPPANQIVHVRLDKPVKGFHTMDAVRVTGTLKAQRDASGWGASGYLMQSASVQAYSAA